MYTSINYLDSIDDIQYEINQELYEGIINGNFTKENSINPFNKENYYIQLVTDVMEYFEEHEEYIKCTQLKNKL